MTDVSQLPPDTPVLVGAGQVVLREATDTSPMELAARAALKALAHAGGNNVVNAIDTISITRLFSDSMGMPACAFGRSENPPRSVAAAIGANPEHAIYGQVGGNEPQSRISEFAADIARGSRSVVLLAGGEALLNERQARREGRTLNWQDAPAGSLEDRGWGDMFVTGQEVANGLLAPLYYYGLLEQALLQSTGVSASEHKHQMATMFSRFTKIAASNPLAQFPDTMSAQDIASAAPLNHLYSKRMIARDSVNQGAAVLMCSIAKAQELGIAREHWVFMHGAAQSLDVNVSERNQPGRSRAAEVVLDHSLAMARKTIDEIDLIDLYSCFPCAVTMAANHLELPTDGSRPLTLTGGLPYFGGPGNNYVMHSVAEAVCQLREAPGQYALVTAVGGLMSKYAAGVYSTVPAQTDWASVSVQLAQQTDGARTIAESPSAGTIETWLVNYQDGKPQQAMIIGNTATGERFVAHSAGGDTNTPAQLLSQDAKGAAVTITPGQHGALYFTLD